MPSIQVIRTFEVPERNDFVWVGEIQGAVGSGDFIGIPITAAGNRMNFYIHRIEFEQGKLKKDAKVAKTDERNGTLIEFTPDEALFGKDFKFRAEFIEDMLWNYAFLNRGLTLTLNEKRFKSEHGLKDLLTKELSGEPLYPLRKEFPMMGVPGSLPLPERN